MSIVSYVLNVGAEAVGGKWRLSVLYHLKDGPRRFSEIKRHIPDVSVKVLSQVLKDMEQYNLLVRRQYNETIPVKVTYEIHPDIKDVVSPIMIHTGYTLALYVVKNAHLFNLSPERIQEVEHYISSCSPK